MGTISVSGIGEEELDDIETRVEQCDCARSEYVRTRLRAGIRLWDAGDFDRKKLDELLTGDSNTQDSQTNVNGNVAAAIHRNLSTTDPTPLRDDSVDDLIDIIIEEIVIDALTELQRNNKIEHRAGRGYVKR